MSTLNFNVSGDPENDQPRLIADNPPGGTTLSTHFEGVPGSAPNRFVAVVPPDITGGATLYYQGGKKSFRVIVPPGDGPWEAGLPPCLPPEYEGDVTRVAMIFTPETFALPVLEARGRYFWQSGNRFFLNGCSAFNLYSRYLTEGEAPVRNLLHQYRAIGFNSARIWTAYNIDKIGRLIPREHENFYARTRELNSLCAEFGIYPYWTAFAGASAETLGTPGEMIEHQFRLQDAIATDAFPLLDLHNEFDNPPNAASKFITPNPPNSVLWSQGSNSQDTDPPQPYGRFYARHPGSSEWQRKVGKQNIDFANGVNLWLPGVDDETVRVEPAGETNRQHCHDAGMMGAFFISGATFHSAQGKLAQPFSGPEFDCAVSWCEGVHSVPLDIAQEGRYTHLESEEGDGVIRCYEKTLNGRAHRVKVYA